MGHAMLSDPREPQHGTVYNEKCQNCRYHFHEDDLKLHTPSGLMLCEDCLKEYLAMDEEVEHPSVEMKDGKPVEQYWMGWKLMPVYHYKDTDGNYLYSDFQIYPPDGECGYIKPHTTVERLREEINEEEEERKAIAS